MKIHETEVGACEFDASTVSMAASLGILCTFGRRLLKDFIYSCNLCIFFFFFPVGAAGTQKNTQKTNTASPAKLGLSTK